MAQPQPFDGIKIPSTGRIRDENDYSDSFLILVLVCLGFLRIMAIKQCFVIVVVSVGRTGFSVIPFNNFYV